MVKCQPSKLNTRVRFPHPAQKHRAQPLWLRDNVFVAGGGNRKTEAVNKIPSCAREACRRVGVASA